MNILFGPPSNPADSREMLSLFFSESGKHIVCGGSTSIMTAEFLEKPLKTSLSYKNPDIPPISEIEGVDLTTEGIITLSKVLLYLNDFLSEKKLYSEWKSQDDSASLICQMISEENVVNFFVGKAENHAHDNLTGFDKKSVLVSKLCECLRLMGKQVNIQYF